MNPDIWIVRDGDMYRLLYGHLHLANELAKESAVIVDIGNEGPVRIVKTPAGFAVESDNRHSLLRN
jgi:hypothetical protein